MFCPDMTMNRAQAAVFLLRGEYGASYMYPPPPYLTFQDDFSSGPWAQPWVQGLYNAGMTAGCSSNPMLFCAWDQTTRLQLAVFGLRLKYGTSYPVPVGTGTVFADMTDPTFWGNGWAEAAYSEGLIQACGTQDGRPLFCPTNVVDRATASYTIVKAKSLLP